ncbi:3'(2'),5'-bisphosphate nucleotidase CysQ [Terricaulis sp.]|uniref:3'(2'),5'-bisphosphate nucleotidase CysQ n=1 Tax=Terricaulis sp. TaxID=2768686 RepID=UPI003783100B
MDRPSLDALIAIALDAGREIMRVREIGFEAMKKGDGSPVTIADQRAEAVIEKGLHALMPDVPMIGEEAVAEGRVPTCGQRWWCVDPLDGTRDFVAGLSEFTVNIALIEDGFPVMGVVLLPVSGEMFAGEPGRALKGVYDIHDGRALKPSAPIHAANGKPTEGWRVFASRRSGAGDATTRFLDAIGPHTRAAASSSLKFCRLAEGAADLYPRFGDVNEWDAAAGHAVLAAAGGDVMRLDATPLRYGTKAPDFLIHGFVAYANEEAADTTRTALKH